MGWRETRELGKNETNPQKTWEERNNFISSWMRWSKASTLQNIRIDWESMKQIEYIKYLNKISEDIRNKPLNTVESDSLKMLLQGHSYNEIATKLGYDPNYIGDMMREIYGLIGQKHRVKTTRANLVNILEQICDKEPDDTFYGCHGIKPKSVFNSHILSFTQNLIMVDVSLYWKFDAFNKALMLKSKYPVIVNLQGINYELLGYELLQLSNRDQVSGDAILELLKILNTFLKP